MIYNVGLDIGYAMVKAISNGHRVMFPSAVGSAEVPSFALMASERILLHQGNENVLVGQDAVTQSRFLQRREDRSWIRSKEYNVLVDAVLSEIIPGPEASIRVVSGLPIAYFSDAGELRESLVGTRRIHREGRQEQVITVEQARIIPQPFGAVMSVAFDERGQPVHPEFLTGTVGVVDIGGHTTNLLAVTASEELVRATTSIDIGVWDVVRSVRDQLSTLCRDLQISDHALAQAIVGRSLSYYGEKVDLTGTVEPILERLSERVIAAVSQLWGGGAALDYVLFCGGGSYLVGDAIAGHFSRHRSVRVLPEPELANVIGFLRFANYLQERGAW